MLLLTTAKAATIPIIPIDSRATYLLTNEIPSPQPAIAINLAALGLQPGDFILLERLGAFLPSADRDASLSMVGVFSSTHELAASDVLHRVTGAIEAGNDVATLPTFNGPLTTDIAEDFAILGPFFGGTAIIIPEGAAFLFVSANDSFFRDNINLDYSLQITLLDTDRDGVLDEGDDCVPSDMRPWVVTGIGETSIPNVVDANGCTIQDYVNAFALDAVNRGAYVSAVAALANRLVDEGVITENQKGELVSAAAQRSKGE